MILIIKKSSGHFMKKKMQKTNQKYLRIEKVIKRKGNKHMLYGKDMTINLIVRLIKMILN